MDALVILAIVPFKMPVVFLARADVFGNPFVVKLLHFIKILPAYRSRNGFRNLTKNNDVFEQCAEVLQHRKAIGIMPEGSQGLERRIRPLVKGVFRISFSAQELTGENVKIVPVGIDYGSLYEFGKHCIVNIGEPVSVNDYVHHFNENPAKGMNILRDELSSRLSKSTVDFRQTEKYRPFETATAINTTAMLEKMKLKDTTANRFLAQQELAKRLLKSEENEPQKTAELVSACEEYDKLIKEEKTGSETIERTPTFVELLIPAALLVLGAPFFTVGTIINILPFYGPVILRKSLKIKDRGFFTSFNYALAMLFTFPVFYTLNTVVFAIATDVAWWGVLLFAILQYPSGKFAYKWYIGACRLKQRLVYRLKRNTGNFHRIEQLRKQVIDLVMG
jgi:1-acyl-sn-glycerol-3-phosphate acyltransferase